MSRIDVDIACARFVDALDREDCDTQAAIWLAAAGDDDLYEALVELIDGLDEEGL